MQQVSSACFHLKYFALNFTDELLQLETLPGPLLVDNMENEASKSYGSFPDRLYIVLNGKIVYQVTQGDPN